MKSLEFVQAAAQAIKESSDIVLADETDRFAPVAVAWGISTGPDTIVVTDSDGDQFIIQVSWVNPDA